MAVHADVFAVQEKQKKDAAAGKSIKQSAGELRMQKGTSCMRMYVELHVFRPQELFVPVSADMSELKLTKGTNINFPEGKDKLMHFEIRIQPEEGIYK